MICHKEVITSSCVLLAWVIYLLSFWTNLVVTNLVFNFNTMMLPTEHWNIFTKLRGLSDKLVRGEGHERFFKTCVDEDLRIKRIILHSSVTIKNEALRRKCREHCITAERGIRSELYDYHGQDRKSNIKLFHMWKSELRNVTTNWEYGYLIDKLMTEQNKSRAKIHEIKERKLERRRDEKNLNPIRPGLFSRSPGQGGGGGAQRPRCQKSRLTSTN